jgi:NDP-sugar pyrophosphorylase family protein
LRTTKSIWIKFRRMILLHIRSRGTWGHLNLTTALIMAGGRSERMRRTFGPLAKPLLPVLGAPLVERNLMALLRAGLREVVVAAPAGGDRELEDWAHARGCPLALAAGGELTVMRESRPRGNIGCAGDFHGCTDSLLVVFADNLTTLDLSAVVAGHLTSGAALTLAVHDEPFHMPYGEVETAEDSVTAYVEKPVKHYRVCSAVSVLGPAAMAALHQRQDQTVGLTDLFRMMSAQGLAVRAHHHAAEWIDVNDATALARAEALVADHRPAFDLWASEPSRTLTILGARGPALKFDNAPPSAGMELALFDDLDDAGHVARWRLLRAEAAPGDPTWLSGEGLTAAVGRDARLRRALAILDSVG